MLYNFFKSKLNYLIIIVAASGKSEKEWELVLLNTLSIVLEECSINKHWCLTLVGKMFDELTKTYERTKILNAEMFLIIKIISQVAVYYDAEELILTKKLLNFIFQSLLNMSYENSRVSNILITQYIILHYWCL